jgi:hypothetical protein
MLWPTSLQAGKILLLSGYGNFNVSYIRRSLELCGVPILVAVLDTTGNPADLSLVDTESVIGCVAVDLPQELVAALRERYPRFPLLCVSSYFGMPVPDVVGWMCAPFASYQVIERLIDLVRQQYDRQTDREPR